MTLRATGQVRCFRRLRHYHRLHAVRHEITAQSTKEGQPQAESNASPIYGITIPAGYRDWRLISVNHLAGDKLKQVRAQLGNDIAIKAFREGKLRSRTAQSSPRCIGMKPRRKKTTKSWPSAFPAPASNLPLPGPPQMFSSWSRI